MDFDVAELESLSISRARARHDAARAEPASSGSSARTLARSPATALATSPVSGTERAFLAPRRAPVAGGVLRAVVEGAVLVIVAEIPWCSHLDQSSAPSAEHMAGLDEQEPPFTKGNVVSAVATHPGSGLVGHRGLRAVGDGK
jgi:hypothetical protein